MAKLMLPKCPDAHADAVSAWREPVSILTYGLQAPDKNPMFLERRVYQGSSGKVYPLPFYDRVDDTPRPRSWDAVHIENKYLRLMILPQIGGRIHVALDKTNGHDFIYRQDVIKPALVGLAGPWISGGIEFNWPQHHRPSTYMPCDVHIESHDDGSKTVWLSEHEPMNRMKGMHGVCLHPDKSYIELKVRLYNRTELTQTFLWWANVATRVHEKYQSFFPPDACVVADHAKRAMSRFPLCDNAYYGVNYGERGRIGVPQDQMPRQFAPPVGMYAPNDLSWYANIPVPTSYMCMGTKQDFFGGYDHAAGAGIVHVANHHISPGKKQWTWGNHEFGYAWDRNLTDPDEKGIYHPYIELMAGVFTDNQPDFSFLAPGETRAFSQYWYPIRDIGPAQHANSDAAVSLNVLDGCIRIGVCTTAAHSDARVVLARRGVLLAEFKTPLAPDTPFTRGTPGDGAIENELMLTVYDRDGRELIAYQPQPQQPQEVPPPATEIPLPDEIQSIDELYISGLHLEQYRHTTRSPEIYWREALRRDPSDSRCNNALGLWHFRRGEFEQAEPHFRRAIQRLTLRNPNPLDGEPFYNLGLTLRHLDRDDEAYDAFYKATWNVAWQSAAFFALAQMDCRKGQWSSALEHLDRAIQTNANHLQARNLKALVLRKLQRNEQAERLLQETLDVDPLDWWAHDLLAHALECDAQVRLDLALDYAAAGFFLPALKALDGATPEPYAGTEPLLAYSRAYFLEKLGLCDEAQRARAHGAEADPSYCFPSRLAEIKILNAAIAANPRDAVAPYLLGNLLYDRQRYRDAIDQWELSTQRNSRFATVWRNLGIAYFNVLADPSRAAAAYDKAIECDPNDARLLYERDQLRKRIGEAPAERLARLSDRPDLVAMRDDLTIELCTLYNLTGKYEMALRLLSSRRFQPWEGGEGLVLTQYVRTHLALGRAALASHNLGRARKLFEAALHPPENLGETWHLLANQSEVHYWLGVGCESGNDPIAARRHWHISADASGDFQEMSVRPYSEMSYYSALALNCLGRESEARQLLCGLLGYAESLLKTAAQIDYFATSLPTMLLFNDNLDARQQTRATFLKAQALLAMDEQPTALALLKQVLERDPGHLQASDLLKQFRSVC